MKRFRNISLAEVSSRSL